jgi:phosphatidylserine decarboxylase
MEANTNHFWNLKNSIELENAFQEKERMSSYLRLGSVPAHVSHPIAAALAGSVAMDVDEEVMIDGVVQKVAQRSPGTKEISSATRATGKKAGIAHMEPFTKEETDVGRAGAAGVQARKDFPGDLVSRNIKMRARNAQTRLAFANTDAKRAA